MNARLQHLIVEVEARLRPEEQERLADTQWKSGNVWALDQHPEKFRVVNTISDAAIRCVSEEVTLGFAKLLEG
ncbi:hypothetical protein [Amaricoccus sp.]|uniref:hypothetical protein n=1 Tax=Amaricoccus sp. TaxID=1872485 RepID=UPI001B62DE74|nr:hypothetical protein [Amaricoccus sp.]MBP7241778.1 hypothetical protein [Amaricoccus sp.]